MSTVSDVRNKVINVLSVTWKIRLAGSGAGADDGRKMALVCLAVYGNAVMDSYSDYSYDFVVDESDTIHSYTSIAVISLATGQRVDMGPEI